MGPSPPKTSRATKMGLIARTRGLLRALRLALRLALRQAPRQVLRLLTAKTRKIQTIAPTPRRATTATCCQKTAWKHADAVSQTHHHSARMRQMRALSAL